MWDDVESEATSTDRIYDLRTGKAVGLLYRWEDGKYQPLWLDRNHSATAILCNSLGQEPGFFLSLP